MFETGIIEGVDCFKLIWVTEDIGKFCYVTMGVGGCSDVGDMISGKGQIGTGVQCREDCLP